MVGVLGGDVPTLALRELAADAELLGRSRLTMLASWPRSRTRFQGAD
jgi:hypothetical protein